MLDFWYSERCTREHKLVISITICAVIYFCSTVQQLMPLFAAISIAIGIAVHVARGVLIRFNKKKTIQPVLRMMLFLLPVVAIVLTIQQLPAQNKLYLAIQVLGFSLLGFIIVSIYQNRAKRFD